MTPTAGSTQVLFAVIAVMAVIAVPLLWERRRFPKVFRCGTVLAAAVSTMFAAGLFVNARGDFFPTWGSLTGGDSSGLVVGSGGIAADAGRSPGNRGIVRALTRPRHHLDTGGIMIRMELVGARSHITRPGAIYVPAGYLRLSRQGARFPVIELLGGSPSSVAGELTGLRLAQHLDTEIAASRMPPTIVVIPSVNPNAVHDDECANSPHGDADETYLATDVPHDITAAFQVRTDRLGWAVMGYSTGGFGAVNLALHHPDTYATAVALSGYFTPLTDPTTGNLYGRKGSPTWLANDPQWQVTHHPLPPTAFLLTAGTAEHQLLIDMRRFFPLLTGPSQAEAITVPRAGHGPPAWEAMMQPALDFIGQRLGGVLAPPAPIPATDGVSTRQPGAPTTTRPAGATVARTIATSSRHSRSGTTRMPGRRSDPARDPHHERFGTARALVPTPD